MAHQINASSFWVPSVGEERYLNLVAATLVLVLLSLGFEILKLPASISPNRPPVPQFVGLFALILLNLVLTWLAARDDFVRFSFGFPRVMKSLGVFMLASAIAFLVRGMWDGSFVIDTSRPISWSVVATIGIAAQFVTMLFFSTYFLKKTDTAKVREYKRLLRGVRQFVENWLGGTLDNEAEFEVAYQLVVADMKALPEVARELRHLVPRAEAEHARMQADLANQIAAYLGKRPTAQAIQNASAFRTQHNADIRLLLGQKAMARIEGRG